MLLCRLMRGMKHLVLLLALLALPGCKPDGVADGGGQGATSGDPILPVAPGQRWVYKVEAEVSHSDGRKEKRSINRVRTYLGETRAKDSGQTFECFEISDEGTPVMREYVRIEHDRVLTCGSLSLARPDDKPILLNNPVPFVRRGLQGGEDLPEIVFSQAGGLEVSRKIRVIGPERVDVKAGRFDTIKIRFTGQDGPLRLRRMVWFAEGSGIVKEEKERFTDQGMLTRETHELIAIEMPPEK
jgi:hypothetical protein